MAQQMVTGNGSGVSEASTAATGDSFTGAASKTYTWTGVRSKVLIQNNDSAANMYVKWNATSAATDDYDFKLVPGASISSPDELAVVQVSIYSDAASTYGTDFVVRGWE